MIWIAQAWINFLCIYSLLPVSCYGLFNSFLDCYVYLHVCAHVWACVCHSMHGDVKGHLTEDGPLLLPDGFWILRIHLRSTRLEVSTCTILAISLTYHRSSFSFSSSSFFFFSFSSSFCHLFSLLLSHSLFLWTLCRWRAENELFVKHSNPLSHIRNTQYHF